jgi:hypothetical protein
MTFNVGQQVGGVVNNVGGDQIVVGSQSHHGEMLAVDLEGARSAIGDLERQRGGHMSDTRNSVFLSYRREVGGFLTLALYQRLRDNGIDVFYDIESVPAGKFDDIIRNQISQRPYFLLVLTPGTLNGCVSERDWVRCEIEHAMVTERKIVPVHISTFDFRDFDRYLPRSLAVEVARWNAHELSQRGFDDSVRRLVERFLLPVDVGSIETTTDRATVQRILQTADTVPRVTEAQLSAHQ